jgi:hypothetical protein
VRPACTTDNSTILAVPNAKARLEAQNSISPLSLEDLLRERFIFCWVEMRGWFYSRGKSPRYALNRALCGPHIQSVTYGKQKYRLSLPGTYFGIKGSELHEARAVW